MDLDLLSESEKNLLIDYGLKWIKIGLSTEPVDMPKAIEAVKKAYKFAGLDNPKIFLGPFNNPVECAKAQIMLKRLPDEVDVSSLKTIDIPKGETFTIEELWENIDEQMNGNMSADWLSVYDYIHDLTDKQLPEIDGLIQVAKECGWWTAYDKVVFIQQRPEEIHLNEKGQLHNDKGPAVKWRGEDRTFDIYALDGKAVSPPP